MEFVDDIHLTKKAVSVGMEMDSSGARHVRYSLILMEIFVPAAISD